MKIGKLSANTLNNIIFATINKNAKMRSEIKVRPVIGEDCAAVDFGNEMCIISSDPITGGDDPYEIGYLAVHVNCNDIASSGGEAVGIMLTILLPPCSSDEHLQQIMNGAAYAASETNIEIIGGHTEVTDAVNRTIVSATIVGKTNFFTSSSNAKVGQKIIMTKYAGLEGTAILANQHKNQLAEALGSSVVDEALKLYNSISIINDSSIAVKSGAACLHDATEGGILGACYEMAESSRLGININLSKILITEPTKKICEYFGISPYKLISSGCLLIASDAPDKLITDLKNAGIAASVIGEFTESNKTYSYLNNVYELTEPDADELYRVSKF